MLFQVLVGWLLLLLVEEVGMVGLMRLRGLLVVVQLVVDGTFMVS